jgi:threonine synthase
MGRYICMACEFEYDTDEEEPVCTECGGTMINTACHKESLRMIEEWMAWSASMEIGPAMETLLFVTVLESKNRGVPAALYLRRLVEKWKHIDAVLGDGEDIAEA